MSGTREENVFMARLAEQADRHEDMMEYMKRVAQMGSELSVDERNLLAVAFKNCVGMRRQAWRQVAAEQFAGQHPETTKLAKAYQGKIEEELNTICNDILDILVRVLIPKASDAEGKVYFLKMKGDYHRYLAELYTSDKRTQLAKEAHDAYQTASEISDKELDPAHPISVGLALNFSVFFNEVYGEPAKACKLAKSAFDGATPRLSALPEEQQADSSQILALIRSNLDLWISAMHETGALPPDHDGMQMEDL